MTDFRDAFGIAARKDIALELRPVHQPVRRFANGFQPAQAVGERGGHFLRARSIRRRWLRQQQARFQIGEPRRHHEIVAGELQADLSRCLDEGEILVGQRQDGNF
jgi:hypothetical protein